MIKFFVFVLIILTTWVGHTRFLQEEIPVKCLKCASLVLDCRAIQQCYIKYQSCSNRALYQMIQKYSQIQIDAYGEQCFQGNGNELAQETFKCVSSCSS